MGASLTAGNAGCGGDTGETPDAANSGNDAPADRYPDIYALRDQVAEAHYADIIAEILNDVHYANISPDHTVVDAHGNGADVNYADISALNDVYADISIDVHDGGWPEADVVGPGADDGPGDAPTDDVSTDGQSDS